MEEPKKQQKKGKEEKQAKIKSNKEESLREVLGYFTNQVDEKKFIPKKAPVMKKENRRILAGEILEQEEITQDEFLNQNEFAEMKGNYDDWGLGDLCLVFPNPDCNCPSKPVNFKQAEKDFDEILTVMTDEGVSKSQLKKERDSFLLAFLTLADFQDQEQKKQKQPVSKEKGKNKKLTKTKTKRLDFSKSLEKEELIPEDKTAKDSNKTSYQKYLEIQKIIKANNEEQKLREKKQKALTDKKDVELDEQIIDEQPQDLLQAQISYIDPIKELLKVNLSDTSQFSKVKKEWSTGGFLVKKTYEETDDYDWICQNTPPRDYLTLVRFTVMARLSRNGALHVRSFVSADGERIFMVIKSNRSVIMRQAEQMKITKQLELGYADLFSLEPVDESFRPLRLKNYITDYQTDQKVKELVDRMDKHNQQDDDGRYAGLTIEDKGAQVYQIVKRWQDVELRANIVRKQRQVTGYIYKMSKDLNIDMSQEKVEIIHDYDISRAEWEAYYVYLQYICDFMKRMAILENYEEIRQNKAFLYRLIFRKAVGDANEFWQSQNVNIIKTILGQQSILLTLWDRLQVPPIPPFTDFFQLGSDEQSSGSSMWRKYEVNEKGLRSEFINMEKIRITYAIVLKTINILKMIESGMALEYFPLHDPYQLKGISKEPFFSALKTAGLMNEHQETQGQKELRKLFQAMEDEAESTDFDSECVEEESAFDPRKPWSLPIDTMRDYFGEKVALYFDFLCFYTRELWYMAVIGCITQGLVDNQDSDTRNAMNTLFAITIIVWSTLMIEFWKREQVIFSVQFGQQNFEEDEAERPAFVGKYRRSITNDDLNEEYYSPQRRKMKIFFSLFISFLIIAMVIACVLGIFTLRGYLKTCNCVSDSKFIIDNVPAIMNSAQIQVFNIIYQEVGMRLNYFENHKILSSYENSYIAKIFIFIFVNTFNSFFIIAFLNKTFIRLNLCDPNCFKQLQTQMITIFLVTFFKNIPELIQPLIMAMLKKRSRTVDEKPVVHPFNKIDSYIEEQSDLQGYQTNDEVDGTVDDYMELVIQFSFLTLFGLAFPVSFLLAFVTNVAEIQVDKLKLTKFSRRPFPQGASNIGNWLIILEVITFFGIFCNAGLIVYTSDSVKGNKIVIFSVLLIVLLASKYLIRFIVPDEPESAIILNKRHQYAEDKVVKVKGFAKSRSKSFRSAYINSNIAGVSYEEEEKAKEIISEEEEKLSEVKSSSNQDSLQSPEDYQQ